MMYSSIWPDWKIEQWAAAGGLEPYSTLCLNPASVDLRWSGQAKLATHSGWHQLRQQRYLVLQPRQLVLLDTIEYVRMPTSAAGMLMLKSSMGRAGLEHLHAGYFDPGFHGTATLEVVNMAPWPVELELGQRIVQLVLLGMAGHPDHSYADTGRYNGQRGPTEARPPA